MKRHSIKDRDIKKNSIDVRPLDQRESKLNTRKGMPSVKGRGNFDTIEYKEQNLFEISENGISDL